MQSMFNPMRSVKFSKSGALLLAGMVMTGLLGPQASCRADESAGLVSSTLATMPVNQIVQSKLYPQLDYFFKKMVAEKRDVRLDGVLAFQSNDKFLPGKIAAGLGHVLLNLPADDPRLAQYLNDYRDIADLTVNDENHTWGIYYYMQTLLKLKNAGLLERAISPATLAALKEKLDWRKFVNVPEYTLINLPTNYYGVAFSIARLRMLMGWEDDSASKTLLDKMMSHYAKYSGEYGFSDETDGDGRFDRYSILLIAEICERYIETGMTVTPELKALLRRAASIALNIANTKGEGFSFGRSIGTYGETSVLEILSVAAYLDVLTPQEKQYAYAYAARINARYVDFWFNPAINSVDMWGQGRRTDAYRGKHRILGENFSLLHQLISTNELWNKAGLKDQPPKPDLQSWLDKTQPRFSFTRFAKGDYDRALAIFRDRQHVFSLLMVNGGPSQHANSPYYPLPFSNSIVSGVADSGSAHAQLLPKFTLADGSELIGTAYISDIRHQQNGKQIRVSYHQDALTRLGGNAPIKDARIQLETVYTMAPGQITRTDKYTAQSPLQVARLSLDFASFSEQATLRGNKVSFAQGTVTDFSITGLQECAIEETRGDERFKSPNGPMKTHLSCSTKNFSLDKPLTITWVMKYH